MDEANRYIIEADHLKKSYAQGKVQRFQALKGISFKIKQGECFGFLGHNGAGKTTALRMVYGLSPLEEGSLKLFGQPVRDITPPALKARLGVVPQEDNLDEDLNVIENLEVHAMLFDLKTSEGGRKARQLLSFMGLEGKEKKRINSLSGGMKRRLVIARALINQPEIVILDEPTTGLDPKAKHLVWQKLRSLKEDGVTLLLTTHDMYEAAQLCDRLIIMHEGNILAEGSPEELVKKFIPPYVVELRVSASRLPAEIAAKMANIGGEVVQVSEGLFLYGNDIKKILDEIYPLGIEPDICFSRAANLEDVFFKLTGQKEDDF